MLDWPGSRHLVDTKWLSSRVNLENLENIFILRTPQR